MIEVEKIDVETWYTCVLLTLASNGVVSFVADGETFHSAYGDLVAAAKDAECELRVQELDWMDRDQIYGICQYAEDMIAFGMSSRLISLVSPDLIVARINCGQQKAKDKLDRLLSFQQQQWFNKVVSVFQHRMGL